MSGPFNRSHYSDPRPSRALMRVMGVLNRRVILPRVLRVHTLDLPPADEARLRAAIHPGTAAFVTPNHPEFMTDWMLDRELSRRVAPRMAHWASHEIVNAGPLARRFWLANHLIANTPGGGGKKYSIARARAGDGVLLHAEGTATWCADRIGPLVPGVADLALATQAAEARDPTGSDGAPRPVWIVPVVWKLHFDRDVSAELNRDVTRIADALRLSVSPERPLEERFSLLHAAILRARCRMFGHAAPRVGAGNFFEVQATLKGRLIADLNARHGTREGPIERWLHSVRRSIRSSAEPARAARDLRLAREIERLHRIDPDAYGAATLTQERMAESLKQLRSSLLTRGWRHTLNHLVPVAVAPRIARIRVPEPLAVGVGRTGVSPGDARDQLMADLAARMQRALDALNDEIATHVDPFRRPNPWFQPAPAPKTNRRGSHPTQRSRDEPLAQPAATG